LPYSKSKRKIKGKYLNNLKKEEEEEQKQIEKTLSD